MELIGHPALHDLVAHLAKIAAANESTGWHTFSMNINVSPDSDVIEYDGLSLVRSEKKWLIPLKDLI